MFNTDDQGFVPRDSPLFHADHSIAVADCPTLRLTQVGTLNRSTTTPFLIKGVALILRHTFNQSLIMIIIKEDLCK